MKRRSTFGWIELIVGIILVVFGIYSFGNPVSALGGIVAVYGAGSIITGIADIAFYIRLEKRTGLAPTSSLIAGIFSIILGVLLVMNIRIGTLAVSMLFPFWFIIHCTSRLASLGFVRFVAGKGAYWMTLIVNVLGLFVGFVLLLNPFASGRIAAYVAGAYLLILGIGNLVTAVSKLGEQRS